MRITYIPLLVHDQAEALSFYVQRLGFEKRIDRAIGAGHRWITISYPGHPTPQLVLQDCAWGASNTTKEERQFLVGKQEFFLGIPDIKYGFAQLKAKHVKIIEEPTKTRLGMRMSFKDLYGNVLFLLEPKERRR